MSKSRRKTALIGKLLERVRKQFRRVMTGYDRPAITYTAMDCLMCGLAIFLFKFPSMLKFDDARDDPVLCGNLRRLFGFVRVPTDSALRRRFVAAVVMVIDHGGTVGVGAGSWLLTIPARRFVRNR